MAHGVDNERSRRNRARVRDILMNKWDPIGVAGIPEASDEYDNYVGKVYVMLMDEQASAAAITDYLYYIATDYMGLSQHDRAISAQVADILVALRPEFEDR